MLKVLSSPAVASFSTDFIHIFGFILDLAAAGNP